MYFGCKEDVHEQGVGFGGVRDVASAIVPHEQRPEDVAPATVPHEQRREGRRIYHCPSRTAAFDCRHIPNEGQHPILREEVEEIIKAMKMGKSPGVDNIPVELVQAGGEAMIDILTSIYNKIWKTGEWSIIWAQSLVIRLPKKNNL